MRIVLNRIAKKFLFLWLICLSSPLVSNLFAQDNNANELIDIGASIYLKGKTNSDQSFALIGKPPSKAPIKLFPCKNCHGADGNGRKEGGIESPNITWHYLTKPYLFQLPTGRQRPAYTEETFKRALFTGVDSAGQTLSHTMPRYKLTDYELESLLNFLQKIEVSVPTGIDAENIWVGVSFSDNPKLSTTNQVMKIVLNAFFDDINQGGGVYGRKVRLIFSDDTYFRNKPIFVMLDLRIEYYLTRNSSQQLGYQDLESLPVIKLFGNSTDLRKRKNSFSLYSKIDSSKLLTEALVKFSKEKLGIPLKQMRFVTPELAENKLKTPELIGKWLDENLQSSTALFIEASDAIVESLLNEFNKKGTFPILLIQNSSKLLKTFNKLLKYPAPVFAAMPPVPEFADENGIEEYNKLAKQRKLSRNNFMAQLWTLTTAKVIHHALKEAGRTLQQEKLVKIIKTLYRFSTGYGPPITFSANRRIGAKGAAIIQLNPEIEIDVTTPLWISIDF
jgi:hypothetical protein